MNRINKPLLRKVMEKIEELPSVEDFHVLHFSADSYPEKFEVWDQGEWFDELWIGMKSCGTAACFAGWTAILDGASCDRYGRVIAEDVNTYISLYARDVLGLDQVTADKLFMATNTKADLRRIVNELLETPEEE